MEIKNKYNVGDRVYTIVVIVAIISAALDATLVSCR